jgi:DNA-binding CsgD family transcriptional regulator
MSERRQREQYLRSLLLALSATMARNATVRTIVGGLGVGKSALLRMFRNAAEERGCATVDLRCASTEGDVQFSLVRRLVAEIDNRENTDQGRQLLADLVLADTSVGSRVESAEHIGTLVDALAVIVRQVTTSGPLVITVDDGHFADAASLTCLACLVRWHQDLPLLLVLALAEGEPAHAPAELRDLPIRSAPLVMSGLSLEETGTAARQTLGVVPDATIALLHDATDGNPLYLRHTLHLLERCPPGPPQTPGQTRVIAGNAIGHCVYTRLSRIRPAAAKLVTAAALLDAETATLSTAAQLAGLPLAAAAEEAEYLIRIGVLNNSEPLGFRLPIQPEGIVGQLSAVTHHAARLNAARYLYETGAPASAIARQLSRTDTVSPFTWTVPVMREAARQDRAHAVQYLQRALRQAVGEQRAQVAVELADATMRSDPPAAVDHFIVALGCCEDEGLQQRIVARLGFAAFLRDNRPEALHVLHEISRQTPVGAHGQATFAALNLACVEAGRDPLSSAFQKSCTFLRQVSTGGPRTMRAGAKGLQQFLAFVHTCDSSEQGLLTDDEGWTVPELATNMATNILPMLTTLQAALWQGRLAEVEGAALAGAEQLRQCGLDLHATAMEAIQGIARTHMGEFSNAQRTLQPCLQAWDEAGIWRGQSLRVAATSALVTVLTGRGELKAARRLLNESGLASDLPNRWPYLQVLLSRSALESALGDIPDALEDLRYCAAHAEAHGSLSQEAVPWRSHLALTLHRAGQRTEANQLAEQNLQQARTSSSPLFLGQALLTLGVVGGDDAAIKWLEEAVRILEKCNARGLLAQALVELGCRWQKKEDQATARALTSRALGLAKQIGAAPLAELAGRRLVTQAQRQPTAVSGLLSLTPQERRVLSAALHGKSNTRIAERMHVTRRTVELHLSNSYRKLGIRGRSEFASLFRHEELWSMLTEY